IVATAAFGGFRWLLAHLTPLLWWAWTRKGAALLSLAAVWGYGLLAGLAPSTQRAVIMVTIFLLTFFFEKEHDSINTLALAAMFILAVFPPALFAISFQLSFAAVLSIIYGMTKLPSLFLSLRRPAESAGRFQIRSRLMAFLGVSLLAIGGTLPLTMYYFNQVSTIGLLANFLIVPLIGLIVVPLGLMAAFLSPLSGTVAALCLKLSATVLAQAVALVTLLADLPLTAVKTVTPSLFEIGCFYALAWGLLNLKANNPQPFGIIQTSSRGFKRRWVPRNIALFLAATILLAGMGDASYWLHQRFGRRDLRLTVIDVGQGSATLLELPGGYTMLVDGGGFADNSAFDMGALVIAPFLWRKKIKTVDTLVLSHPNSDHLNGLIYIAQHFKVKNIWSNRESKDTLAYRNFMEVIARRKIHCPRFEDLPRRHRINGVELDILYPPDDFLAQSRTVNWRNANNNSLVLRVSFGSKSFLLPGDIMAEAENELVRLAGDNLASTVLLAPHHGSKSSNTGLFLDRVKPEMVIISAGRRNRFLFPHPAALKTIRERNCRILRTDIQGAIALATDGHDLVIKPFIPAPPWT
ncbi:MAG: DNA internalization-related competence protein ComEC/Rec2, partial [Desulfobacterales bacterium]